MPGGTEPILEVDTYSCRVTGLESPTRGVVSWSCCPPTRRPRVLGSQSGGSQDQLVASQAACAPGLSGESWALNTFYFLLSL